MDEEEQRCMNRTLGILNKTKQQIEKVWADANFDFTMFDVLIDLRVKVDEEEVRVRDIWKRVQL